MLSLLQSWLRSLSICVKIISVKMKEPGQYISDASGLAIHILGIGEITTTIEVKGAGWGKLHPAEKRWMKLAYKRMPAFDSPTAVAQYLRAHNAYQDLLGELDIRMPWHDNLKKQRADGKWIIYNRQERYPTRQVACLVIRELSWEDNLVFFNRLLRVMSLLFQHNLDHPEKRIGFDGQIPNWILPEYDFTKPRARPDEPLLYLDTSTPLLRYDGKEQLDTELFLRSVPSFTRPLIRKFLLQGILDRYYLPREVITDLLASYITHGRPDLLPQLIPEANRFLAASAFGRDLKPYTEKEIRAYNREDVFIWKLFRSLKRFDRYLGERFFHKPYEQRLPKGSPATWKNLVGAGGGGLSAEEE